MNWLESAIATIAPNWALRRTQARALLRAYEAAMPSRLRKEQREFGTADQTVMAAGRTLAEKARYLEQNYDLARGVLNTMVDHIIGAEGIQVDPQPKTKNGEIHEEYARQLDRLYDDFCQRPEVTWQMGMAQVERILCRSWLRDGEALSRRLSGTVPGLDHGTRIPMSLELIEADYLPIDYNDASKGIVQGIEKNSWGRPRAYHLYKRVPTSVYHSPNWGNDTRPIFADQIAHIAAFDRLHQTRGVSVFASVLTRFADIKDYDESERVAARIAAAMAMQIIKGEASFYAPPESQQARSFPIEPGMMFDQLLPGEKIETIQSNRPSPMAEPFRDSMIRAACSGMNTSYSSVNRKYDGSFSSQRQELVEQDLHYRVMRNFFVDRQTRPTYRAAIALAVSTGQAPMPKDLDPITLFDAAYQGPAMVWIDPAKEAIADEKQMQAGTRSLDQTIRARGGNPREVYAQILRERKRHESDGMVFSSNAAYALKLQEPANDDSNSDTPTGA